MLSLKQVSLIIAVLWLCGCQTHAARPASVSAHDSTPWRERAASLYNEYILEVTKTCMPAGTLGRPTCVRETVLASFGNQGGASTHCPQTTAEYGFFECVMLGSTAERMLTKLGPEASAAMKWEDPIGSLALASKLVGVRATIQCGKSPSGACLAREMASTLGLYPSIGDQCAVLDQPEEAVRCVADSLMIDQLESALLYVG